MHLQYLGTTVPAGIAVTTHSELAPDTETTTWLVENTTPQPIAVERVQLRWKVVGQPQIRMFRHGYQSWSASGGATFGTAIDPSRTPGSLALVRGMHHADPAIAGLGELRSELVTIVADDESAVCLGFDGGDRHDGTFRITGNELEAEVFFGGAVFAPGERREMHRLRITQGACNEASRLLDVWATWAGKCSGARIDAPYQVGWCSWYQYFHDVTEADVRDNLAAAADWPIDVFQLDDGYQACIGDWLLRADTFPTPLEELAADIERAGYVPGIWLAPFLCAPTSRIAAEHPEWVVQLAPGKPLIGMVNPGWGGTTWALDTSNPEVLAHLESLAATLVGMGWRYLKLDFTYAPSLPGLWHDPSMTPAQRVRAGYDAIRRGAGDDVFILGCGAPLGACIGVVDGMRIGADVAPHWGTAELEWRPPGYEDCEPATVNAWRNTLSRSFMHRRLWVNDPDCLMLRTQDTSLTEDQMHAWAYAVAMSGGMALISDNLALLDSDARKLLDEVIEIGRAVDAASIAGNAPQYPNLLDGPT